MTHLFGSDIPLPLAVAGPLLVLALGAAGWFIGSIAVIILTRGARKTPSDLDDVLLEALKRPIEIAAFLGGTWFALRALPLPPELDHYLNRGWIIAVTLLLVSAGLRVINGVTRNILQKSPTLAGASGMIRVAGRLIVISLGGVMLLQSLGVAVEPLVASLGIGSLAVGFALKDTLSNLFAGIYLFVDRPIRVGDYVKLEGGEEGFVHGIGWRATKIRMLANNMIVVPNSKLTESILTNYDMPESMMSLSIEIPVPLGSDPDRIMRMLLEEARTGAVEVPGMLPQPEPTARLIPGFGTGSLGFTLSVAVRSFADQFLAQSEMRRRVYLRLQNEGIEIPLPQRTLHAPEIEKLLSQRMNADSAGEPGRRAGPESSGPTV